MKVEHYAHALVAMTESGKTPKEAVAALAQHLDRRGMRRLLGRLPVLLSRLGQHTAQGATLTVADRASAAAARKEAHDMLPTDTDVSVHEDDSIIGGWQLHVGTSYIDNSHKQKLLTLYKQITH